MQGIDISNMTPEEIQKVIDGLAHRVTEAEAAANRPIRLKVSEKGAMSVYGLGRFPFTFYKSQAKRLFDPATVAQITQFLLENDSALKAKGDPKAE